MQSVSFENMPLGGFRLFDNRGKTVHNYTKLIILNLCSKLSKCSKHYKDVLHQGMFFLQQIKGDRK